MPRTHRYIQRGRYLQWTRKNRPPKTNRIDAGIRRLSETLNREDSQLRSCLLDAALAGLRLARNPESRELRRDAARIWATIEPILSHHLEAEDSGLLPWLDRHGGLSPEAYLADLSKSAVCKSRGMLVRA